MNKDINDIDEVQNIQAERQDDYGDAGKSFDNIAELWRTYIKRKFSSYGDIDIELDRTDVAVMMMLMKASRFAYQRKEDSALDMASYASIALRFSKNTI